MKNDGEIGLRGHIFSVELRRGEIPRQSGAELFVHAYVCEELGHEFGLYVCMDS